MLRQFSYIALEHSLNRAYQARLTQRGNVAEGVFWRNKSAQLARFNSLLKIVEEISKTNNPTIADVGCGYGAMYDFMQKIPRYQSMQYQGVDINRAMIKACKNQFPDAAQLFSVGRKPRQTVDFILFSGTFNLCHTTNIALWEKYIFSHLQQSWNLCRNGIILNLLCDKTPQIRNQIYYASRKKFIDDASRLFGPTYAISTPQVSGDVTFILSKA